MEEVLSIFRRSKESIRFDRPVGWIAKRSQAVAKQETRREKWKMVWLGRRGDRWRRCRSTLSSGRRMLYVLLYRIYKKGREFEKERKGEGGEGKIQR